MGFTPHSNLLILIRQIFAKLKNLWLKVFFVFVGLIIGIVGTYVLYQNHQILKANSEICSLLEKHYIEKVDDYVLEDCQSLSKTKFYLLKSEFLQDVNLWLSSFNISHLYLYSVAENQKMWEGIGYETGIFVKKIFGKWKVTDVQNPKLKIKVGDEILKINGAPVRSSMQVMTQSGEYEVQRDAEVFKMRVNVEKIHYNESITHKHINLKWSYLKIPTFKSEFFAEDDLQNIFDEIHGRSIILDLRGNLGGNFVSILRILSHLICEEKAVGKIFNARESQLKDSVVSLQNNLDDGVQIEQVMRNNPVFLKTFEVERCYKPPKIIIILNEKTASVSELLVQILTQTNNFFKSYGAPTSGHMLLAIWYPIEALGEGFMMSIPYAWSTDLQETKLEGMGVQPSEHLSHEDLIRYKDSHDPLLDFILDAINADVSSKQL